MRIGRKIRRYWHPITPEEAAQDLIDKGLLKIEEVNGAPRLVTTVHGKSAVEKLHEANKARADFKHAIHNKMAGTK